ncbi:hypothetical protein IWW37_004753 [Coemansia sp. RSA 2050]|nr:hypothetical protein IWW37_004753 [Coemansia sp. RSA 2050]KAJ2732991.1 hypothetical protein IW152_003398 [Coemansia sp. BCRC 34962]
MSFTPARTTGKSQKKRPQQQQKGGGPRHKNKAPTAEPAAKAYRDRAAERREGGAGDYADSEALLGHIGHKDKKAEYEQSKYLGGDVAHTHLVKGLDFLLLEKLRGTSAGDSHWDNEVERLLHTAGPAANKDTPAAEEEAAITPVGGRVMAAVMRINQARRDKRNSAVAINDLFLPGRMCFEIAVAPSGAVRATTRIRSQEEVNALAGHSRHNQESDREVLTKVIAAIAAGRHRRVEARFLQRQYLDKPSAVADAPVAAVDAGVVGGAVEEEEDIFADAGVDYHVDAGDRSEGENEAATVPYPELGDEAVTAPYPELEDETVTAPYPSSDGGDEDGVTAPYPMSEDDGDEEVTAPYPISEDEGGEDGVTVPYPMSEDEDAAPPAVNPDNDIGDIGIDDAELFAMARSRFKEETSELLSRPQPDSAQSAQSAKRKAATQERNEWNKTQQILQTKYQRK